MQQWHSPCITKKSRINPSGYWPYIFVMPFCVIFALFWVFPIGYSMYMSLTQWSGLETPVFVGLDNYVALFSDPRFYQALRNTIVFAVVYNLIMLPLALGLALALNSAAVRFRVPLRAVFFIPVTTSLAITALIFILLYDRDIGFVNVFFRSLGFNANFNWLKNPNTALGAIVSMRLWRATGYYSTFFLAALQTIPKELSEAAIVDGAKPYQVFRYITLPLLKPMAAFIVIMSTIASFQIFDEPWITNQGGPCDSTLTLSIYMYQSGFLYLKLGYGAAIGYVLTVMMWLVALVEERIFRDDT